MKNLLRSFASLLMVSLLLIGCDKKENKVFYTGNTTPVLTASSTTLTLAPGQDTAIALRLNWTNPNYQFTTGNSSQDVTYLLEIDTANANFGSARKYSATIAKDLATSYNVGDLNSILGNTIKLDTTGRRSSIEVRITASINGTVPVMSNVLKISTNAFNPPPKVALPTTGNLYLVGDATPGGWANPVPTPSQQFTKISNTVYEITVPLLAGKSYLMLPLNGDWADKYGGAGATGNSNNPAGDVLKRGGSDLKSPDVAGTYKIRVNFQDGTFTLTKI